MYTNLLLNLMRAAYEGNATEAVQWHNVKAAMHEMGMSDDLISICRILSFVLVVGNVEFEDEDISGTPHARVTENSNNALVDAAHVIQCSPEVNSVHRRRETRY